MIHDYPWTDMHELNLDWFLEEFKKYYEKVIQQDEKIQSLDETVQQFTSFVTNYFDNLDVQQEINNKLDAMAASGELQAMLQPYFDGFVSAVDDQITTQNRRIDNLVARMDEFTNLPDASTAGDAELADIRVSFDNITYPNAGDAVRDSDDKINTSVEAAVDISLTYVPYSITIVSGGYYNVYGSYITEAGRRYAEISAIPGDKFELTTTIRPTSIPAVAFFNDNTFVSYLKAGTGATENLVDYQFTVPSGVNKVFVQNIEPGTAFSVKKYGRANVFRAYTKSEINAIFSAPRYGIKWEISNTSDLGTRCFAADGLSATIGLGSTDGSSDFDNIYPWSKIRRCNIKKNVNGASVITYEGEADFALDGSNGDVFVEIPKFYYERYIEAGYEYRVISEWGNTVHPAFVEDGKELDHIYVGAFEGVINNSKLGSIAGVIPTSNETIDIYFNAAISKGKEYSLYDMRTIDAIWNLMAIEYGKRNTNQIFGYGLANFEQPVSDTRHKSVETVNNTNVIKTPVWSSAQKEYMPVGSNITICSGSQYNIVAQRKLLAVNNTIDDQYTEWTFDGDPIDIDTGCFIGTAAFSTNFCEDAPSGALNWHTGRTTWNVSALRNSVRYRWIENIVGNLWHMLPDITFNNLQMYKCDNMSQYDPFSITDGYKPVESLFPLQTDNGQKADIGGYNYWITNLAESPFIKDVDFGTTWDKALTSTKAFGAYYYLYNGRMIIANGGGFDHFVRCNVLTMRAWIDQYTKWYLYGARLIYKNI